MYIFHIYIYSLRGQLSLLNTRLEKKVNNYAHRGRQGYSLRHVRRDPCRRLYLPNRRGTRRGFSAALAGVTLLIRQGESAGKVVWCAVRELRRT